MKLKMIPPPKQDPTYVLELSALEARELWSDLNGGGWHNGTARRLRSALEKIVIVGSAVEIDDPGTAEP